MKAAWTVLTGALSISVLAVPVAGNAQPAVEQFRFDPPQPCLGDVFQWGFSYRRIPAGLAAVKDLAMEGVFEGRTVRSPLTPAREDLQPHTADQGRFQSLRSPTRCTGFWLAQARAALEPRASDAVSSGQAVHRRGP